MFHSPLTAQQILLAAAQAVQLSRCLIIALLWATHCCTAVCRSHNSKFSFSAAVILGSHPALARTQHTQQVHKLIMHGPCSTPLKLYLRASSSTAHNCAGHPSLPLHRWEITETGTMRADPRHKHILYRICWDCSLARGAKFLIKWCSSHHN